LKVYDKIGGFKDVVNLFPNGLAGQAFFTIHINA